MHSKSSPLLKAVPAGVHRNTGILFLDGNCADLSECVDMSSPELENELIECGFRHVGEIGAQPLRFDENPFVGDDADEVQEYMTSGSKNGVLISVDELTFAEPEFGHGAHHVRMRSLLESGDIVETRLIPDRYPRNRIVAELCGDDEQPENELDEIALQRQKGVFESLLSMSDEEEHPSFPSVGLWRQSIRQRDMAKFYAAHQKWLSEVQARVESNPQAISSTSDILQITRRGWHIVETNHSWSLGLTQWIGWFCQLLLLALFTQIGAACGLGRWFAGSVCCLGLGLSAVSSRLLCAPLLWTTVHLGVTAFFAMRLNESVLNGVLLAFGFTVSNFVVELFGVVSLMRCTGALTRMAKRPGKIRAADLAQAYPDPKMPGTVEGVA